MYLSRQLLLFIINVQLSCVIENWAIKLDTPQFHALFTPELKILVKIFEKYGLKKEVRIVGGAVRDLLLGRTPVDLDLATTVTPQEMKDIFNSEGVRVLNSTGEKHGTLLVHINSTKNFEITSLHTAGRLETLQLTKDWFVDATRRDLTINSMFLDFEGNLYDYHNGYDDLKNNRFVFTKDADKRIKEDYGAILRYFRIFGRVSKNPRNHDEKTLQVIRDNASGLLRTQGKRIWSELRQILTGNFINEIFKTMLASGLFQYIGLNHLDGLDIDCFDVVCNNSKKYSFEAITFIASLLRTRDQMSTFCTRVTLPAFECDLGYFIVEHKRDVLPKSDEKCLKNFQRMLIFAERNYSALRIYIIELLKFADRSAVINRFDRWAERVFQVNKTSLKEKTSDESIGIIIRKLKEEWIKNDSTS